MSDAFTATLNELERSADRPERFSASFLDVFPITGVSVSTVGEVLGSETISATDELAARLDELQFDLGEGPCWEALRTASAVTEPDFTRRGAVRWPSFASAVDRGAVASIFAFPLSVGELQLGAIDLYSRSPVTLSPQQCTQATAMADVIGRHVLREALSTSPEPDAENSPYSRRTVHQATGVVLAQLDVDAEDALLMIQARAFATGQSMMDVATAVVSGSLSFTRSDSGIEARS